MAERMCIVTREVKDEQALIRFVRAPDGTVTPDLMRKLPGRGVWVSVAKATVAEAQKRNLFARGFGEPSTASADLADQVGQLLRHQAISVLSLARKAGEALCGFMKVEEALRKGPVRLLLHAASAAPDGVRKLDRLAQEETVIFAHFSGDDLDLAFGRANVVHAAIATGGLAEKLVTCVGRLASYEGLNFTSDGSRKTGL